MGCRIIASFEGVFVFWKVSLLIAFRIRAGCEDKQKINSKDEQYAVNILHVIYMHEL